MNEKHMQLGKELREDNNIYYNRASYGSLYDLQDNVMISYFLSVLDDGRDKWVRALLDRTI